MSRLNGSCHCLVFTFSLRTFANWQSFNCYIFFYGRSLTYYINPSDATPKLQISIRKFTKLLYTYIYIYIYKKFLALTLISIPIIIVFRNIVILPAPKQLIQNEHINSSCCEVEYNETTRAYIHMR